MNHKRSYLSTSALKAFAKSPNHYIEYVNGERKATPAMELGSAIHCAILEPNEWHDRYTIVPKVDRRTKAGKEAWELFQKSSEGKTVLTDEQHRTMDLARIAVHADPLAKNLIDTAVAFEQERETVISHTPYRGIADIVGNGWVADLKTAADGSPDAFQRQAFNLKYHEQAAAYCRIFGVAKFYFIVVETTAPYNTTVFEQSADARDRADGNLMRLIHEWEAWDGTPRTYTAEVQELNLPRWA